MISDTDTLLSEFDTGRLIRPDWTKANPVALARAVSAIGGYWKWGNDPVADEIGKRIGEPDHTVLVIADGFGMNFVRKLPEDSFARTHLAWEQPALVPSSTGPDLTSLFSGEYPTTHGFVGWWVYLPQIGERATVYEWVRESDGQKLDSLGVEPADIFLSEPFLGKLKINSKLFMPSALKNSLPTLYSQAGGAPVEGFEDIEDGVQKVVQRVLTAGSKSMTVLYWNLVDVSAHIYGVKAPETAESVNGLDVALGALTETLNGKARIIVTADHGHLDIPKFVQFDPGHPLAKLMKCTQSGDPRFSYCHVADGQYERFAEGFRAEFGEHFFLLTTEELLDLRLLGPELPSETVRERLGDFTAISRHGVAFTSRPLGITSHMQRSTHAGLSVDEMMVPVLMA